MKTTESIKTKVENLSAAAVSNTPIDNETAAWLAKIADDLHAKLASVGLIAPRQTAQLGPFLAGFIDKRKNAGAKASTLMNFEVVSKRLVERFGADRDMRSISEGEADNFLLWMQEKGYAVATIGRSIRRARQFFKAAIRNKLIERNPFAEVKASNNPDKNRQFFVGREVITKAIDAAPNHEWQLIIALSRYGGLRCPSEHVGLRWIDINWEKDRFLVHSPKQEHLANGGDRWVPIFPELRPFLERAFEGAEDGAEFVITKYRDAGVNLRTEFMRIIKRAGCIPWPKLFHNLRASRETELAAEFPIHVVTSWLGNTPSVAQKHYLQTREEDFERAAKCGAESGAVVVQNAVQQAAVPSRVVSQDSLEGIVDYKVMREGANRCNTQQVFEAPREGLELLREIPGKSRYRHHHSLMRDKFRNTPNDIGGQAIFEEGDYIIRCQVVADQAGNDPVKVKLTAAGKIRIATPTKICRSCSWAAAAARSRRAVLFAIRTERRSTTCGLRCGSALVFGTPALAMAPGRWRGCPENEGKPQGARYSKPWGSRRRR